MIFIAYIYNYNPTYRVTLTANPIRETKHQLGMALSQLSKLIVLVWSHSLLPIHRSWLAIWNGMILPLDTYSSDLQASFQVAYSRTPTSSENWRLLAYYVRVKALCLTALAKLAITPNYHRLFLPFLSDDVSQKVWSSLFTSKYKGAYPWVSLSFITLQWTVSSTLHVTLVAFRVG